MENCKQMPPFDPDHPENYMDYIHDTDGYAKPIFPPGSQPTSPDASTKEKPKK